jgi:threonine synthase
MKFYSTRDRNHLVDFEQAVFQSLPADGGLYMPREIPALDPEVLSKLSSMSFTDIALEVSSGLLGDAIPHEVLRGIVTEAINFPAPVVKLSEDAYVLELFHGPSMAFKDFGARFMSRIMAYFLEKRERDLHILVATSGDTGGAVAMGFYQVPHIHVTILYPSGKVSPIQERQLTTLGENITALEVEGTFDDCQRLVKQAFLDEDLNRRLNLSSANSINISRLIPQSFYYLQAVAQLARMGDSRPAVFSVPSGNFGNLTAGLFAERMGMPCHGFVASTNVNDEVPRYLATGTFTPRPSLHTISNAMDVGNPSNFQRMEELFSHDARMMADRIGGYSFTDEQTREAIRSVFGDTGYIMCPHTAVAWLGLKRYLRDHPDSGVAPVFLSTAHPCKFEEVYDQDMRSRLVYPGQVKAFGTQEKRSTRIGPDYDRLKKLLETY